MCLPAAAAGLTMGQMLAVSLATTAASAYMAQSAAVDQAKRQNAQYLQNADNARVAFVDENRALNRRLMQEGDKAAVEKLQQNIQAEQVAAKQKVSAGEGGIAGNTVAAILRDTERVRSVNQGTIQRNFDWSAQQIADQKNATQTTFVNRLNSVAKGSAPSAGDALLGMGVNMATDVAGNYMAYKQTGKSGQSYAQWLKS